MKKFIHLSLLSLLVMCLFHINDIKSNKLGVWQIEHMPAIQILSNENEDCDDEDASVHPTS